MSTFLRLKSLPFAVVFGLVLSLAVPPLASAQQTDYTSENTGATITWTDEWEIGPVHSEQSLGIDGFTLEVVDGTGGLNFIFTADQFDREEVREALLTNIKEDASDYSVIDAGDYDNLAYELSSIEVENSTVGSFILVLTGSGTTAIHIVAPIEGFAESVAVAQRTVQLNGSPVLDGIDGDSLQAQLEAAPEASNGDTSQPSSSSTKTSETSSSQTSSSDSSQTYTDPVWGYTVSYPADWSSQDLGIGDLDLVNDSSTIVGFGGLENPGVSGSVLEGALMETFLDVLGPNGTFVTSASNADRAVFVGETDGMIMIQELIIVSPSVVVIVTAVVTLGEFDAEIDSLQDIEINGTRIFGLL